MTKQALGRRRSVQDRRVLRVPALDSGSGCGSWLPACCSLTQLPFGQQDGRTGFVPGSILSAWDRRAAERSRVVMRTADPLQFLRFSASREPYLGGPCPASLGRLPPGLAKLLQHVSPGKAWSGEHYLTCCRAPKCLFRTVTADFRGCAGARLGIAKYGALHFMQSLRIFNLI